MTKDSFIRHMDALKTLYEDYNSFFNKLYDLGVDISINDWFTKLFDESVKMLEEEVGGGKAVKEDIIGYYIYETDWGNNGENCITIETYGGKCDALSLTNFAELYDYIRYLNDAKEYEVNE